MVVINLFDFFVEEYAEKFTFSYEEQLRKELIPYFELNGYGPLLRKLIGEIDRS